MCGGRRSVKRYSTPAGILATDINGCAIVHQKVFAGRIFAIDPLNRILHRSRQLTVRALKLFKEHVAEPWIGFVDANRVHELLYVVIHVYTGVRARNR